MSVPHCLCPIKKPRGRELTVLESAVNKIISFSRSRVEQVNAQIEVPWYIFRMPWRGSPEVMVALVTIIIHSLAYEQRSYNCFRPVGPWSHDPALW